MDLSTIKRKLDTGEYTDPWEYCDDVWLMFDNAWLYNKKTSRVYKWCSKVSNISSPRLLAVKQQRFAMIIVVLSSIITNFLKRCFQILYN